MRAGSFWSMWLLRPLANKKKGTRAKFYSLGFLHSVDSRDLLWYLHTPKIKQLGMPREVLSPPLLVQIPRARINTYLAVLPHVASNEIINAVLIR